MASHHHVTLRQRIVDEILSIQDHGLDDPFNGEEEAEFSGKLEALEKALQWIDEDTDV